MELYGYEFIRESDLTHHGIKGQKWGIRRFQNDDGTWTAAGKERYGDGGSTGSGSGSVRSFKGNLHRALAANYGLNAKAYSKSNKTLASINKQAQNAQLKKAAEADAAKAKKMNDPEHQKKVANLKKAAKVGAVIAGTALVAYGGYKLNKVLNEKVNQDYIRKGIRAASKADSWMESAQADARLKLSNYNLAFDKSTPSSMRQHYKDLAETARAAEGNSYSMGRQAAREASAAMDRVRRYNAGENYSLREKADVVRRAINKRRGYHYYS